MKTHILLFLSILLSLCLCSKKEQKSIENTPADSSATETEAPISDPPEEPVTISPEDTVYPDNILQKLKENTYADSLLSVHSSDVNREVLFGMQVWIEKPLSSKTSGNDESYIRFYNPELLKKIDKAIDISIVKQVLSKIKKIDMSDVWTDGNFTQEIPLFETDQYSSLLLHRMFLKLYPGELSKLRARYERYFQSDTIEISAYHTLGVPPGYRGDIMAFWVRRSFDSTDVYFESILRKATSIIYPRCYRIIDSTFNEMKKVYSDEQVVMTYNSYDDEVSLDPQASLFPGRENMLHNNACLLDSILGYGTRSEVECSFTGDKALEMVKEYGRSAPFTGEYSFYGLLPKAGSLVWMQINPEISLAFKSYPPSCGEPGEDNWALHLTIGIKGDTTRPVLMTAIKSDSRRKPGQQAYLLQGIFDKKCIPESDTAAYVLTTNYILPHNMKQISNLWKVDTSCYSGGEVSRRINLKSSLFARWPDGTVDTIYNDEGYGHYSFVDAEITDIILTDIDSDGILELYFTTGASGSWIGYLNKNNSIRLQKVKKSCDVAVGGC